MKYFIALILILMIIASFRGGEAATLEQRTFQAEIVYVTDGDSLVAYVSAWQGTPFSFVEVRLDGIDAPESRKQDARCTKELKLGLISKAWLRSKLPPGTKVKMIWSETREKYGRVLAVIMLGDENINKTLVRLGHAVPYEGGTKLSWC